MFDASFSLSFAFHDSLSKCQSDYILGERQIDILSSSLSFSLFQVTRKHDELLQPSNKLVISQAGYPTVENASQPKIAWRICMSRVQTGLIIYLSFLCFISSHRLCDHITPYMLLSFTFFFQTTPLVCVVPMYNIGVSRQSPHMYIDCMLRLGTASPSCIRVQIAESPLMLKHPV